MKPGTINSETMKPFRILMLVENAPYPQDVRVRREANALVDAGYRVAVIAAMHTSKQPFRETLDCVEVYRFPRPPSIQGVLGYAVEYGYAMLATFALSLAVLFQGGFDAIHAACPPDTYVFIAAFYKLLGKKFVYDHHDLAPEMYDALSGGAGNPLVRRMLVALERLSCRVADRVIATNESYARMEMERDGVPRSHIKVVRNGIELDRIMPSEPNPALRATGKMIIGYMGLIGYQDGVDCMLHAIRALRDMRDDFLAVIVGHGDAIPMLKALAADLDLDDCVRFAGWIEREELGSYLSAMDICVAPEPSNAYNDRSTIFKLMEYMAWSKPIVAFDLPEHRVTAGDLPVYAPPNDVRQMAGGIAELMDDPARRAELGARGRERVAARLAWRHSVPPLLELYRQLDGGRHAVAENQDQGAVVAGAVVRRTGC